MDSEVLRGTIETCEWQEGSGIGVLRFEDGSSVPFEAGSFFRAARQAYCGSMVGKEIVYTVDDLGVMRGFCPAEDYDDAGGEV